MTNLIRFSPTSEMRRLQREIDTIFDNFFPTRYEAENSGETTAWTPRVDLAETEDAYFIQADVPGLKKDDIEINYQDGTLTVRGERTFDETSENRKFVRVERSYGRFYRAFTLPKSVNESDIQATFEDGVLTIEVPKAEETKPRRIEIS
jgi:HSP20 family protein